MKRLLLIVAILWAGFAHGATYYVATNGSDAAAGTRTAPWKSISTKLGGLADGDELVLLAGTYQAPVTLPQRASAAAYVTLRADVPRTAIITTTSQIASVTTGISGSNWVRLQGLDLRGFRGLDQAGPLRHLEVVDCKFSASIRGIQLPGPGSDWTFRNVVHDRTPHGILLGVKGSANLIEGVLIEDCQSLDTTHPDLTNTDGFVTEENVRDCTIRRCLATGAKDSGFDLKASPLLVERCEARGNSTGFKLWSVGATLRNCLSIGNADTGATLANDGQRLEWCTFVGNVNSAVRPQGFDNQTQVYLGCVFDGPLGTWLFRNGYNDTVPKFSYCLFRGGDPTGVWYYGKTLQVRYRDLPGPYLSPTDKVVPAAQMLLDGATGLPLPGSPALTLGPNGSSTAWVAQVPQGVAVVPPVITPPVTPPPVTPPPIVTPPAAETVETLLPKLRALTVPQLMELLRRLEAGN